MGGLLSPVSSRPGLGWAKKKSKTSFIKYMENLVYVVGVEVWELAVCFCSYARLVSVLVQQNHFITGVHPFLGTNVVTPSSRKTSSAFLPVTTLRSNCGPRTWNGNERRSEASLLMAEGDSCWGSSHTLRPLRLRSVKPQARRSSERYHRRWYMLPMVFDAPW